MHEISVIVCEFVEEVLNQGRIEAADRFVWDDMVEQVPFPGQGPGLQGPKDVLRGMRAHSQICIGTSPNSSPRVTACGPASSGRALTAESSRRARYGGVGKSVGHGHRPHSGGQD